MFRKGLYVFLILKILLLSGVFQDAIQYTPFHLTRFSRVAYAPVLLAQYNVYLFRVPFLLLLVAGIIFRHSYYTSFLILWFSVCLSKLTLQITNGSDLVLNLFLMLVIFMEIPKNYNASENISRLGTIAGAARLVAQIQLALIYFYSGYNKLLSEAWRSGAAIYSITKLTFFQNPYWAIELKQTSCMVLGWSIIIFEIAFALLIWFKGFRLPLLVAGCLFHLSIIAFIGIPDFGIIMILTYCVFLPVTNAQQKPMHSNVIG
jgi:hypothetical protein